MLDPPNMFFACLPIYKDQGWVSECGKRCFTKGFLTKNVLQRDSRQRMFSKEFLTKNVLPRDSRQRVLPRMFYQGILNKECFTKEFSANSDLPRDSGMQLVGGGCQIVCWRAPPCTAGRGCALTKPSCVLLSKHRSVLNIQFTLTCHVIYICYKCM